jgi:hypothetical protein
MLAGVGQFPAVFGRDSLGHKPAGLLITSGLVLVVSNVVDLSAIASVGSAIALFVFLLVALAGYRRRADTGASAVIALAAIAATAVVLAFFAVDTARNEPATFVAIVAIVVLSIVLNLVWSSGSPRSEDAGSPAASQPSG